MCGVVIKSKEKLIVSCTHKLVSLPFLASLQLLKLLQQESCSSSEDGCKVATFSDFAGETLSFLHPLLLGVILQGA